jgi:hypothetical protein
VGIGAAHGCGMSFHRGAPRIAAARINSRFALVAAFATQLKERGL